MRDPKYRKWLTHQRCLVAIQRFSGDLCDGGLSDAAHTVNNGMSSKGPDSSCVPLCRSHHQEYDAAREAFENRHGFLVRSRATLYYQGYLAETGLVPKSD